MQRRGWVAKTAGLLVLAFTLTGCVTPSSTNEAPAAPAKSPLPNPDGPTAYVEFEDFALMLTADKSRYKVNETPKVTAELRYTGDRSDMKLKHGDPLVKVGVTSGSYVSYTFTDTDDTATVSKGWTYTANVPPLTFEYGDDDYSFYAGTNFTFDSEEYSFSVRLPVVVEK